MMVNGLLLEKFIEDYADGDMEFTALFCEKVESGYQEFSNSFVECLNNHDVKGIRKAYHKISFVENIIESDFLSQIVDRAVFILENKPTLEYVKELVHEVEPYYTTIRELLFSIKCKQNIR